ncbi:MAG: glycine cleavage system protein GcvH [Candidatus Omnitrophica bacterium]|nr:glycine cleavage system protein GcvH [Candidatus Omnitrophota bacterium]
MTDRFFSKTHEWVRLEDDSALIGITDYAQKELGDIVFVELPSVGEKLTQFSRFGTIESTKAASDLYSPLSGEVIEVNNDLVNHPEWINQDPYGKGWMVKIKVDNRDEIVNLLEETAYKSLIEKES